MDSCEKHKIFEILESLSISENKQNDLTVLFVMNTLKKADRDDLSMRKQDSVNLLPNDILQEISQSISSFVGASPLGIGHTLKDYTEVHPKTFDAVITRRQFSRCLDKLGIQLEEEKSDLLYETLRSDSAEGIVMEDMESIASFQKIVKKYLQMKGIQKNNE